MAKISRLKPRVHPFSSSRKLASPAKLHEAKRITGHRLIERNRRLLQKNPLCVECLKMGEDEARRQGFTVAVDEWDHKIPLWEGGIDHETNLQGLCFGHHEIKSEAERIRREQGGGLSIA